jgi:hypothetical protein
MSKAALPEQPTKTTRERPEDRKAERSAAALRDNLKRRKAQQRARDEPARDASAEAAGEQPGRRKP